MATNKNPSAPFYWNDWDSDPELRSCGLMAQGLWMRMLCHAARSPEPGFVVIGKAPGTPKALAPLLAQQVNQPAKRVLAMIEELLLTGTASQDDRGWVYCRRMARAADLSAKRSVAGKAGAEATHGASHHANDLPDPLPTGLPPELPSTLPEQLPPCLPASDGGKPLAPGTRASRLQDSYASEEDKKRILPGSDFDAWYEAYPRKEAKGRAAKAYRAALRKTSPDVLLTAAQRFARSRIGADPTFTPMPASWLNDERWDDGKRVNGDGQQCDDGPTGHESDPYAGAI